MCGKWEMRQTFGVPASPRRCFCIKIKGLVRMLNCSTLHPPTVLDFEEISYKVFGQLALNYNSAMSTLGWVFGRSEWIWLEDAIDSVIQVFRE